VSGSGVIGSRVGGFLAGLCLVGVLALQAWRVPASARPATVAVDLRAVPTGEVGVAPSGAVLDGAQLTAGGDAVRGTLRLQNRTAGALTAGARVAGGDPALDRLAQVGLTVRGRTVFRGALADLRDGARVAVALPRGGTATVAVDVRLPEAAAADATARSGEWTLTFAEAGAR
jgi:hypothetical protein